MRRRDALILGGLVAVAVAVPPVLRRIPKRFEFVPISGEPGFRRLKAGAVSGGIDPFFGLASPGEPPSASAPTDLCKALFGAEGWPEDRVPVAIFTDVNCPYCRVHEARLTDLLDGGAPIRLVWHELPLLGPVSVRAARATLAARVLGAEQEAREFLRSRALRPGPDALRAMAGHIGLDPQAMRETVEGPRVDALLAESLALGRRLGLPGTPGTVVGRTLVIGTVNDRDLRRLVDVERTEPRAVCV